MRPSRQLRRPLVINRPELDDERSLVRIAGALEGIEEALQDVVEILHRKELLS